MEGQLRGNRRIQGMKNFFVALWCIWKCRNGIIYENEAVTVDAAIKMMKNMIDLGSVNDEP